MDIPKFSLLEQVRKMTATVQQYPNKTQDWYEQNVDWLKTISSDGASLYLREAERRDFITSWSKKNSSELIYRITKLGREEVEKL